MSTSTAPRASAVGLFCSANEGLPERFRQAARQLGAAIAREGMTLVYGGGARGLMGVAATAAADAGGHVIGIMSRAVASREGSLTRIGEFHLCETLMDRKARMIALADGFIALPGGIGTLDEITDVVTLNDIGSITKPLVLCDIDGFWSPLEALIGHFSSHGMLRPGVERALHFAGSVEASIAAVRSHMTSLERTAP